eukprot:TRINITY_DN662_c0_g1_i2.p2 TRINITY_DN662_c0_g1~~TRINITY_DN662_c0_g1_i2.p2  ORF type:complete len:857 (+),score=267.23 TRINITY_DN662_c0_g1_i2:82-2571(+)
MRAAAALCALLAAALPHAASAAPVLGLTVNATGGFAIGLNGQQWLTGGEVVVAGKRASAGEIVPVGAPQKRTGANELGQYEATTLSWVLPGSSEVLIETSFLTYASDPGVIAFEQSFPSGIDAAATRDAVGDNMDRCRVVARNFSLLGSVQGYDAYSPEAGGGYGVHPGRYCDDGHVWAFSGDLDFEGCYAKCKEVNCTCFDVRGSAPASLSASTVFPAFARGPGPADDRPVFSYHGVFPALKASTFKEYKESHQGGMPLVMYDTADPSLPMTVFSPLSSPKAQHMASDTQFVGAGIKATVTRIPKGWKQLFILSAGTGINDGMMSWGDRVLKYTGKPRADWYRDQTHSTIGFWTDNGGYYHYSTGLNKSRTYEEVLPEVKAYHDHLGVPFGHWQFDSWFYPKDGGVGPGGGGGAVTNWTAMPSVFPHGMAYIQSKLQMPMVMHNRQWSDKSDYIRNLPQFKWYIGEVAIPEDPIAWFNYFFTLQEGWGLVMYEQDWMNKEYDGQVTLQQNITMGDLWLLGMATGAANSNRTVQYCMPYPHDVMCASSHAAVTNARATGDYFHALHQWAVGATSMYYWAIGVIPYKDGFYSSNHVQWGGQVIGPELNPDREALMATLSCGMVGPMDGINLLNASRVMTTCRGDGVVLRPDRPVMTADWCFATGQPTKYVYHTYSDVQGLGRVHYHFNNDKEPMQAGMVGLKGSEDYAVYNWYSGDLTRLNQTNELTAGYEGHNYAVVIPTIPGANGASLAFVGEVGKYVTHAAKRFPSGVSAAGNAITAKVYGATGETVRICAARLPASGRPAPSSSAQLVCRDTLFKAAGVQAVTIQL